MKVIVEVISQILMLALFTPDPEPTSLDTPGTGPMPRYAERSSHFPEGRPYSTASRARAHQPNGISSVRALLEAEASQRGSGTEGIPTRRGWEQRHRRRRRLLSVTMSDLVVAPLRRAGSVWTEAVEGREPVLGNLSAILHPYAIERDNAFTAEMRSHVL
jgi:hypothetical protein